MNSENNKYSVLASKVFRIVLTSILVLIPWIMVPMSFEFYDSAKAVFFIILTSILLIVFAIKVIVNKKLTIIRTPLDAFILIWLLISIVSTILSADVQTSVWGYYSRYSGGLLANIFFVIFYFTVVNGIDDKDDYELPIKGFVFSISIFSFFLILQYLNGYVGFLNPLYQMLSERLGFISGGFFMVNSFNTIGTAALIPFILLVLLPLISNNYFSENSKISLLSTIVNIVSIAITSSALESHLKFIVPVLFVATLIVYAFFYNNKIKEIAPKILLVGIIFTISFLVFNLEIKNNFGIQNYEVNSFLSLEESLNVAKGPFSAPLEMTEKAKNLVIGVGPETFALDFTKYKSSSFNSSEYWDLRYSKSGAQALEEFHNGGILGIASITLIGLTVVVFIFKKIILSKVKDTKVDIYLLGIAIIPLIISISSFFVFYNFFLWFLFWVGISLSVGGFYYLNPTQGNKFVLEFNDENKIDYIIPQLILSIATIVFIVSSIFVSKNYIADITFRDALNYSNKAALSHQLKNYTAECEYYKKAFESIDKSFRSAGYKDYLTRNYALVSFNYGTFLFNLQADDIQSEVCPDDNGAFFYLSNAEAALKGDKNRGITGVFEINNNNIENHEAGVKIFSSLVGQVPDFNEKYSSDTITSLLLTTKLDPYNPNHWLNLGIVLYSAATSEEDTNINRSFDYVELANEYFSRAYDLKPDYIRTVLVITQANLLYGRESEALNFLAASEGNFEKSSEEYKKIQEWKKEIVENEDLSELFLDNPTQNVGDVTNVGQRSTINNNAISISDDVFDEIKNLTE